MSLTPREAYYGANPKALKTESSKYAISQLKRNLIQSKIQIFKLRNESETFARAAANATVERKMLDVWRRVYPS